MTEIFKEIRSAVISAESAASFPVTRILRILGIARAWYYRHLGPGNSQDRRFNPYAVRDEEWIVVGYKKAHPKLGFRELAYAMIDEDICYGSGYVQTTRAWRNTYIGGESREGEFLIYSQFQR